MRKRGVFAFCLTLAIAAVALSRTAEGQSHLRRPVDIGGPSLVVQPTDKPAPLGPMPRLDPIGQFVHPIEPWQPDGFGWNVEGIDDDGNPICLTNRNPTNTCDPQGPRAFLHAGFDAAPAPDRVVRASAAGRVVVARSSSAFVTGLSEGEGGGIIVLEHDRDGDPATGDDHLLTIYGHVDPEVGVGQIVAAGDRIALTSTTHHGDHLHFAVRQGAFDPDDLDVFRTFLPPSGTLGCSACNSRLLAVPAFPDLWQDPASLFGPSPFWLAIYGGPSDGATDVLETDGGSLAFGYTWNQPGAPGRSMAVRQLDQLGNLVSQRAYSVSAADTFQHVERAPDGGAIALAVSRSASGAATPMLMKFDPAGDLQWARQYGLVAAPGQPPASLWWQDLAVTSDGGIVVTGTAQGFLVVVARLDAAGNLLWVKTYNNFFLGIEGKGIAPAADGGFNILAEYTTNISQQGFPLSADLVVIHINATGQIVWSSPLGTGFLIDGRAGSIQATPDGGSIVAGTRSLFGHFAPHALWVVKLNADGTIAWSSLYNSPPYTSDFDEIGTRVVVTPEGGYVIAGQRPSSVNQFPTVDLLLLRLDGAGEIVAQKRLDSLGYLTTPLGLRAAGDGGFFLAAGQSDCRLCTPEDFEAARFLIAHLDGNLDCSGACSAPYELARQSLPFGLNALLIGMNSLTGTSLEAQLARVDTTGGRFPCNQGVFGSRPVFESHVIQSGPRTVSCDRTQYAEAFICTEGIPDSQASAPVILDVTYDSLVVMVHVTDADSTTDLDDVASVTVDFSDGTTPSTPQSWIPVLDDGSLAPLTFPYFITTVENCYEDPVAQVCECTGKATPPYSGDAVAGDGIRTFETSLTFPSDPFLELGAGCINENRPKSSLSYFGESPPPLNINLRATDRIGNVTTVTTQVTPSRASMSCSGDACGCCLLNSRNPEVECAGLPGMTSPEVPAGLCTIF